MRADKDQTQAALTQMRLINAAHLLTHYSLLILPTAVLAMAFLVRERERRPVAHVSFTERLAALPRPFRRFLLGVFLIVGNFNDALHAGGGPLRLRADSVSE